MLIPNNGCFTVGGKEMPRQSCKWLEWFRQSLASESKNATTNPIMTLSHYIKLRYAVCKLGKIGKGFDLVDQCTCTFPWISKWKKRICMRKN